MNEIIKKTEKIIGLKLSQGQESIIDVEDYDKIKDYRWYANKRENGIFRCAGREKGRRGERKVKYISRIILGIEERGIHVDHINGNTLDNRKQNLRTCRPSENGWNMKKHFDNKSGYKGVYFHKVSKKYVAQIQSDKKLRYLGLFEKPEDAARAYDLAALEYHKEKEYSTDRSCLQCGTTLVFKATDRVQGGYAGQFHCEVCKKVKKLDFYRSIVSDKYRTENKWREI